MAVPERHTTETGKETKTKYLAELRRKVKVVRPKPSLPRKVYWAFPERKGGTDKRDREGEKKNREGEGETEIHVCSCLGM